MLYLVSLCVRHFVLHFDRLIVLAITANYFCKIGKVALPWLITVIV